MQMRKFLTLRSEVTYQGHDNMIEKRLDCLEQTVGRNMDIKDYWWLLKGIKDNYREVLNHLSESLSTVKRLSRHLDLEAVKDGCMWDGWQFGAHLRMDCGKQNFGAHDLSTLVLLL